MLNLPYSQAFSSRSPKIQPLSSISSWNGQDSDESNSYQQRQLQRLQALRVPLDPPPLQLGDLTPNQEDQVKRLRRLVPEHPPIPTFTRPRSRISSRQVGQIPPTTSVSPWRSGISSPGVSARPPRKRIIRRRRRRIRNRSRNPGLRIFLELMSRYGWVVCCGTWMILVISGGLAGKALINVEHATTYSASYGSPASQVQESYSREMLMFIGAIAVGGAGASFILSKLLQTEK